METLDAMETLDEIEEHRSAVEHESAVEREPVDLAVDAGTGAAGEGAATLPSQSLMVMAMLAMHPRPQQVLRRFRDLLETWRNDPSETALQERLLTPCGGIPSTVEQVIYLLQSQESAADDLTAPVAH